MSEINRATSKVAQPSQPSRAKIKTDELRPIEKVEQKLDTSPNFSGGNFEGFETEKRTSNKIVHTWRRTADGWKIIGGMCGPLDRDGDS